MVTRRQVIAMFAAALLASRTAFGQAPAARPEFEVATVKPSGDESGASSGITTKPGGMDAHNVTVKRCIMGAYAVGPHQVVGGPDWVSSDRYEIVAKAEQSDNDDSALMAMLQTLLADRFKLVLHRETRNISAYVLEVDKKGPKLEKADPGESVTDTRSGGRGITIDVRCTGMDMFAEVLARSMDLPVVNQTGLEGIFNFKLHWTPDNARAASNADDVSIFTALEEQLGLRLHAAKAPVPVLVIDHVERPSEN